MVCKRDMISTMHARDVKKAESNRKVANKFVDHAFDTKSINIIVIGHGVNVINNIHS